MFLDRGAIQQTHFILQLREAQLTGLSILDKKVNCTGNLITWAIPCIFCLFCRWGFSPMMPSSYSVTFNHFLVSSTSSILAINVTKHLHKALNLTKLQLNFSCTLNISKIIIEYFCFYLFPLCSVKLNNLCKSCFRLRNRKELGTQNVAWTYSLEFISGFCHVAKVLMDWFFCILGNLLSYFILNIKLEVHNSYQLRQISIGAYDFS